MLDNLITFPGSRAAELPIRRGADANGCRASEIGVSGIAALLGMASRPRRTAIAKIRLLIETSGFPLPKTPRFVRRVRLAGAAAVDVRARWHRDQVEAWFDDDLPPAEAAAKAANERAATRHALGQRARAIAGGGR